MRHTQCLLTPARALHRGLLLELANTASKSNGVSSSSAALPSFRKHTSLQTSKHARGPGITTTTTPRCNHARAFTTTTPRAAAFKRVAGSKRMVGNKQLRDKDIPYHWVRVAGDTNVLSEPQRLDAVLRSLPKGHSLVMVAPPPPTPPPEAGAPVTIQPSAAICRIIDAVAEAAAAKEAAKEAKRMERDSKTLELNWATAPNDLRHKMKRFEEFLGKGLRVELLLARKRRTRKATDDEAAELVRTVREAAGNVDGAVEYKKSDGQVGGVMRLFYQGKTGKKKDKPLPDEDKGEINTA